MQVLVASGDPGIGSQSEARSEIERLADHFLWWHMPTVAQASNRQFGFLILFSRPAIARLGAGCSGYSHDLETLPPRTCHMLNANLQPVQHDLTYAVAERAGFSC